MAFWCMNSIIFYIEFKDLSNVLHFLISVPCYEQWLWLSTLILSISSTLNSIFCNPYLSDWFWFLDMWLVRYLTFWLFQITELTWNEKRRRDGTTYSICNVVSAIALQKPIYVYLLWHIYHDIIIIIPYMFCDE